MGFYPRAEKQSPGLFSPACRRAALFSSPPLKPPLKNAPTFGWCISYWRKRWDSNPRAREGYLISSFARYCANSENTGTIRTFRPRIFARFLRVLWMKGARKAVSTRQRRNFRILAEKDKFFGKMRERKQDNEGLILPIKTGFATPHRKSDFTECKNLSLFFVLFILYYTICIFNLKTQWFSGF